MANIESKDLTIFNDITYETFGINPSQFYSGKFAGGAGTSNFLLAPENAFDIEYDRARFLSSEVKGPDVLDIGCGSAPYAATIRGSAQPRRLVGIDLDPSCVSIAREVYDDAFCFELGQAFPFSNDTFDTVFSCDVFGHIEFRHKDNVIREIHRVTAPGGRSVHVIESGFLDYHAMVADDPNDPIRQYVRMEGHVGVETAAALKCRWRNYFDLVTIRNAFIYPLSPLATYLSDPAMPPELRKIVAGFTAEQMKAANIVLGYVSQKLVAEIDSEILFPDHTSANPLQRPSGLIYLVAQKRCS